MHRYVKFRNELQRAKERDVFEQRKETESEQFLCQDSGLSQIFKVVSSHAEKILNNINVIVWRQVTTIVKWETSSLPGSVWFFLP